MKQKHTAQVVYCTVPNAATAERLAARLLEQHLAACINLIPGIRSLYRWEGAICKDEECLLLIKTTADQFDALQAAIVEMHPYELPEIIAVPISAGLPGYLAWIEESVMDNKT